MMFYKLFYSPHEANYYYNQDEKCIKCGNNLEGWAVLLVEWNKKHSYISFFCRSCFNKIKIHSHISEFHILLISEPPYDSFPVIIRPPPLIDGRCGSVFDAARLESVKTTDHTVYSYRESIEGATIGNLEYKKHDPKANHNLSEIEFDNHIQSIKNSRLLIGADNHKLLKII